MSTLFPFQHQHSISHGVNRRDIPKFSASSIVPRYSRAWKENAWKENDWKDMLKPMHR